MAYRSRRACRGENSPCGRCMNDSYTPDRRSRAARTPRWVGLALLWLVAGCPAIADSAPDAGAAAKATGRVNPGGTLAVPRVNRAWIDEVYSPANPGPVWFIARIARPSLDVALRELKAAADRGLVPDDYGVGVLERRARCAGRWQRRSGAAGACRQGGDGERAAVPVRSSLRTRASAGSRTPLSRSGEGRSVRDGTARGGRPRSPRGDDRCGRARFPALCAAEAPAGGLPAARGPAGNRAAAAGVAARQDRRRGHLCRRAGLAGAARAAAGPGRGCGRPGRRPVYRPRWRRRFGVFRGATA